MNWNLIASWKCSRSFPMRFCGLSILLCHSYVVLYFPRLHSKLRVNVTQTLRSAVKLLSLSDQKVEKSAKIFYLTQLSTNFSSETFPSKQILHFSLLFILFEVDRETFFFSFPIFPQNCITRDEVAAWNLVKTSRLSETCPPDTSGFV